MSAQWTLEKIIESISEEEAREALIDILLVLTNNRDTEAQKFTMIESIYTNRFYNKYLK